MSKYLGGRPRLPRQPCESCGRPVKRRWSTGGRKTRFCSPECVPRALKSEGAIKGLRGRLLTSLKFRKQRFGEIIARVQAGNLAAHDAMTTAYKMGYDAGYHVCQRRAEAGHVEAE